MTREKDIRKSDFIEITQSESGDYLDLVRNGQNFKIKQSNLVTDFGVTGSLVPVGGASAIPVLETIASVNNIRGMEGGSGISTTLSAQNGVSIQQNYDVDKGGVPIMINETALQPTLVSLEAGAGISVGASGKSIQIALSATPPSTKTVIVYEEADFPSPVGDLITLEPDTYYQVVADISTANRLKFQEGTILAGSDYIITLAYTGVGIFINAADVNFKLTNISITAATGTIGDASSSTGAHFFRAFLCNFSGLNAGNIHNFAALLFNNCNFTSVTGTGLTFTGNFRIALFETVGFTMPSGTGNAMTLGTATFDYLLLDKGLLEINTTGYVISGLANSGNINAGGLGTIVNSRQFGTATFSDNITAFDDRWESQLNGDLYNSVDVLLATHAGATIAIASASTPVIIGATWTAIDNYRFTGVASGRFTYTGKGSHVSITASISGSAATATHTYNFYIYKNSVQVTGSVVTRVFTTSIGNVSMIWEELLDTNDYIEIWIENTTGNADFDLSALTFRMKGS